MKNNIIILALCLLGVQALAQEDYRRDETIFSNSSVKLTGLWGGNTSNVNEDDGDFGIFHGGYFVFEFNKSYTIGWQGYGYREGDLDLDYNGLHLGYAHNPHKVVHPTFTIFAGTGNIEEDFDSGEKDNVLTFLPTAGVEVNVLRWFRIGLEGGYQWVFDNDLTNYSDADVSQPFVGLRLKFGYSWGR
jgi:hypothetical protein